MRWATIPNLVSLLRLVVFIPLTVWLVFQPGAEILATVSLAAFGASDWVDGFLARRLNQRSRVGELLDPLADRVGVILIGFALAAAGKLPWYVIITIFVVDAALLVIALFRMERVEKGHVLLVGKAKTALIMVGLPLMLLSFAPQLSPEPMRTIANVLLALGVVLHVIAAGLYAFRFLSDGSSAFVKRLDRGTNPWDRNTGTPER